MKTKDNPMAALAAILFMILLIPFSYAWSGYVLSKLWEWFVVPVFGLPALSVGYAIGLAIVVGYLTKQDIDVERPERSLGETVARGLALAILSPAIALLVGWLVFKAQGR